MVKTELQLTHGTYNCYMGPLKCRCEPCKTAMKAYMDDWRRRNGQNVGPFPRDCAVCGESFEGMYPNSKYCSVQCRRQVQSIFNQSNRNRDTCRRCGTKYPAVDETSNITQFVCPFCWPEIQKQLGKCGLCGVAWWDGDGTRFCSDECRHLDAMRQAIIEEDYV